MCCLTSLPILLNLTPKQVLTINIFAGCTLNCPYCFAGGVRNTQKEKMTVEDFRRILDFCIRNRIKTVRLTGGEPMLHSEFPGFVGALFQNGLDICVFSNFTVNGVIDKLTVPGEAISFLVNVNNREIYKDGQWESVVSNLEMAISKRYDVTLGYNIYQIPFDLLHVLELARKLDIKKIRLSPANPVIGYANESLNFYEQKRLGKILPGVVRKIIKSGFEVNIDCPMPFCSFPENELAFLRQFAGLTGNCSFEVMVYPDLTVGHCYVTKNLMECKKLDSFTTFREVKRYLRRCLREMTGGRITSERCLNCIYWFESSCNGGCYGLKMDGYRITEKGCEI